MARIEDLFGMDEQTMDLAPGRWLKMELYECYGETTAASGRKYWIFLGWAPMPEGKPAKVTAKFRYYDTPQGREKYRM